jgi:hypothetical protein
MQTSKIVEFLPNWFLVRDPKNDSSIVFKGFLKSKDGLYKLCDLPRLDPRLTALIS